MVSSRSKRNSLDNRIEASWLKVRLWSLLRRVPADWPFGASRWARGLGRRVVGGQCVPAPFYEGKLLVSPFDDIGSRIEQEGILEGTLSEIVRDSARRGFDYVDVGANIG